RRPRPRPLLHPRLPLRHALLRGQGARAEGGSWKRTRGRLEEWNEREASRSLLPLIRSPIPPLSHSPALSLSRPVRYSASRAPHSPLPNALPLPHHGAGAAVGGGVAVLPAGAGFGDGVPGLPSGLADAVGGAGQLRGRALRAALLAVALEQRPLHGARPRAGL